MQVKQRNEKRQTLSALVTVVERQLKALTRRKDIPDEVRREVEASLTLIEQLRGECAYPLSEEAAGRLTPREREIAALAQSRLSTKEIASQLYISPATVKNTLSKIYSKLGIKGKRELYERADVGKEQAS